jgi:hypothetical protein
MAKDRITNEDLARQFQGGAAPGGLSASATGAAGPFIPEDQDVPAVFTNRFTVRVSPHLTRIAFGEALVGMDHTYRAALMMTTSDAKELAETILALISKTK